MSRKTRRYGRRCVDDGARSRDVETRVVPEYIKSVHKNKAGREIERRSMLAQVCLEHTEKRWDEWRESGR